MSKKNLKLIMELIFIFILPLVFMCFTTEIQVERNFEYDNEGNYQVSEDSKSLSFDNSIIKYTKQETIITEEFEKNYSWVFNNSNSYTIYCNLEEYPFNDLTFDYDIAYESGKSEYKIYIHDGSELYLTFDTDGNTTDFILQEEVEINNNTYAKFIISNFDNNIQNYGIYNYGYYTYEINQTTTTENTIWGNIKTIVIDYLDVNDNVLLDIMLCYLFLWFFMFLIWHTFYRFFDWIFHLSFTGGKDNG